jgi:hypothetical protein
MKNGLELGNIVAIKNKNNMNNKLIYFNKMIKIIIYMTNLHPKNLCFHSSDLHGLI